MNAQCFLSTFKVYLIIRFHVEAQMVMGGTLCTLNSVKGPWFESHRQQYLFIGWSFAPKQIKIDLDTANPSLSIDGIIGVTVIVEGKNLFIN